MHNYPYPDIESVREEMKGGEDYFTCLCTQYTMAPLLIQSLRASLLLWCVVAGIQYLWYCVWPTQIRPYSSYRAMSHHRLSLHFFQQLSITHMTIFDGETNLFVR